MELEVGEGADECCADYEGFDIEAVGTGVGGKSGLWLALSLGWAANGVEKNARGSLKELVVSK